MVRLEESCPEPEELAAFLDGNLVGESRDCVEAHLAYCPRCRKTVALAITSEADPSACDSSDRI
ncbi:MAG TPA: zf-HC2 domain-containing protein [Blastocatellia bacterium]|nr:zf-HC2 domain-containing protein [Blastocatellia bacterium]